MGRETLILLAWLAGGCLALALVWGIWWALFADRSRGARRCPRCWHQIDPGNGPCPRLRCGECGHWARFERDLHRTRHRWSLAALLVALLLTGTVSLRLTIVQAGWWTLVPDRVLIAISPWVGDGQDGSMVRGWLRERLLLGRLAPDSAEALLRRVRSGDAAAPTGTEAWRRRYRVWIDALRNPEFWRRYQQAPGVLEAAANVPPSVTLPATLRGRPDAPVFTRTSIEDWLPADASMVLEIASIDGLPLEPATRQALLERRWTRRPTTGPSDGFPLRLGPLPVGSHAGTIRWRWSAADTRGRTIASGETISVVRVEVVDRQPALRPVTDASVTEAVRDAFRESLMLRSTGADPAFAFNYRPMTTAAPELRDFAFGLVVEACERGVPRRTLRIWWRHGGPERIGNEDPVEQTERLLAAEQGPDWTLRVRSDPELAERAAGLDPDDPAKCFWKGSFELPLAIEDMPAGRPARAWKVESSASTTPASP